MKLTFDLVQGNRPRLFVQSFSLICSVLSPPTHPLPKQNLGVNRQKISSLVEVLLTLIVKCTRSVLFQCIKPTLRKV